MQSLKDKFSKFELDCIRFYMGDQDVQNQFRGGTRAYNTINALLHLGIQNELDLVKENRVVHLMDINHLKEYIQIILSIYKSMVAYLKEYENNHLITYKIDRYSTILQMKKSHKIEGFFSTCKYGYLEEYAHIKNDVVLIEIIRDKKIPYLDFECLFKEKYAKPQEAEILIPFYTRIASIEEVELSNEEKEKYYDMNKKAPVGKYRIYLEKDDTVYPSIDESLLYKEFDYINQCISNLMNHKNLNEEDFNFYCNWKKNLASYINHMKAS